tara:strand:- start:689 stop:2944 length:2256 start_codon:yes stop_codon:yes gene_type:complete
MSLKSIINYISNSQVTFEIINKLDKINNLNVIGSNRFAKALLINSIANIENKNIFLVCSNIEVAYKWYGYFQSINNNEILYYPPNENLPYEKRNKSSEVEYSQLNIISRLLCNEKKDNKEKYILITTERALQPHLLNKEYFTQSNINLKKGKIINFETLTNQLIELGYSKEDITRNEGQWSRRGDIIDIFAVNNEVPVRIEFFDNTIEKIREYEPSTQKTLDTINNINITQCGSYQKIRKELIKLSLNNNFYTDDNNKLNLDRFLGLIDNQPGNISDFINKNTLIIFDEIEECKKFTQNWFFDSADNFKNNNHIINQILKKNDINKTVERNLFKDADEIYNKFENFKRINLYEFESNSNKTKRFLLSDKIISSPIKNISKISNEINNYIKNKNKVWLLTAQPFRTKSLLYENDLSTFYLENSLDVIKSQKLIKDDTPIILKKINDYEIEGFYLPIWKLSVFTDRELYGQQNLFNNFYIRKRKKSTTSKINLNKINPGDYIVHKNHGIGRFIKIEKINLTGESRDYLVIQYSDGKVSVAADQLGSINKYRSTGNTKPKVNKLGGTEWIKVKEKNKKTIQKIAVDLLKLYAQREKLKGYAFPPDGPWQNELEDSFPHQPTPDQIKAVKDIKKDMEKNIPMDRLVCGDVGYGKTEVAIRAIFKAITSGKQVILLAPTTILAQQHWKTISNRFSPYPIKVSLLNRFKKANEKKEIIQGLVDNNIDLVIATHQILGKEINIKNLGLLVIMKNKDLE